MSNTPVKSLLMFCHKAFVSQISHKKLRNDDWNHSKAKAKENARTLDEKIQNKSRNLSRMIYYENILISFKGFEGLKIETKDKNVLGFSNMNKGKLLWRTDNVAYSAYPKKIQVSAFRGNSGNSREFVCYGSGWVLFGARGPDSCQIATLPVHNFILL